MNITVTTIEWLEDMIEKTERKRDKLDADVKQLRYLLAAAQAGGDPVDDRKRPLLDAVENVLSVHGAAGSSRIVQLLRDEGIITNSSSVATCMKRFIGKKFKRDTDKRWLLINSPAE